MGCGSGWPSAGPSRPSAGTRIGALWHSRSRFSHGWRWLVQLRTDTASPGAMQCRSPIEAGSFDLKENGKAAGSCQGWAGAEMPLSVAAPETRSAASPGIDLAGCAESRQRFATPKAALDRTRHVDGSPSFHTGNIEVENRRPPSIERQAELRCVTRRLRFPTQWVNCQIQGLWSDSTFMSTYKTKWQARPANSAHPQELNDGSPRLST